MCEASPKSTRAQLMPIWAHEAAHRKIHLLITIKQQKSAVNRVTERVGTVKHQDPSKVITPVVHCPDHWGAQTQ